MIHKHPPPCTPPPPPPPGWGVGGGDVSVLLRLGDSPESLTILTNDAQDIKGFRYWCRNALRGIAL